jgi:hypothetical protein
MWSQAISIVGRYNYQRGQLSELSEANFNRWASVESFKIAPQVYQGLQSGSKTDGKVLPDDYADTAKPIAERRMMLAG